MGRSTPPPDPGLRTIRLQRSDELWCVSVETEVSLFTFSEDEAWNFAVAHLEDGPTPSRLIASFGPEPETHPDGRRTEHPKAERAAA
jgi:hypothetical protein